MQDFASRHQQGYHDQEDRDGRIFFTGARDEVVKTTEEAIHFLEMGNIQRTTAGTDMNATSSRSHAVFTVSLELLEYQAESKDGEREEKDALNDGKYIQSKLHLVDLAGSERAKRTGAVGKRLKESVGINQGLLALGKVIRALTINMRRDPSSLDNKEQQGEQQQHQHVHVPYRESKLTRFLQDSLGGNSYTVMLACVSPSDTNAHETLSTLQYASRTRAVQNQAVANVKSAPVLTADTGKMNQEGGNQGNAKGPARGQSGDMVAIQEEVESSLVNALRVQLGRLQTEMQALREQKRARRRVEGDNGGEGVLLRASIDSLYDSINATDTPLVAGGALVDQGEREGSPSCSPRTGPSSRLLKAAQLSISDEVLPPLVAFKGDLQHGLERLEGHQPTMMMNTTTVSSGAS